MVQISTLLAVVVTLAAVSPSAAFQASSFTPARVHLRSAACHASSRAAGAPALQMGFRDNAKKVVSVVGAVVTIAFGVPRVAKADSPRVLLPSQEAYSLHQQELADGTYKPLPLKIVTHPAFIGGVGICAAGLIGKKVKAKMDIKKTEDYRKNLAGMSGMNVDASILDVRRVNRPGAQTFEYSGGGPIFGAYRPPKGTKIMKDVRDKYVFTSGKDKKKVADDEIASATTLDIFKGAPKTGEDGDSSKVELVDDSDGPKTGEQRALEEEMSGLSMEEIMEKAMQDPTGMDPGMMAAALPQLQAQLSEVLKDGISKDEVAEVRKSFEDMGINLEEMFKSVDDMDSNGMNESLGPEGAAFFKTLRQILDNAK